MRFYSNSTSVSVEVKFLHQMEVVLTGRIFISDTFLQQFFT